MPDLLTSFTTDDGIKVRIFGGFEVQLIPSREPDNAVAVLARPTEEDRWLTIGLVGGSKTETMLEGLDDLIQQALSLGDQEAMSKIAVLLGMTWREALHDGPELWARQFAAMTAITPDVMQMLDAAEMDEVEAIRQAKEDEDWTAMGAITGAIMARVWRDQNE